MSHLAPAVSILLVLASVGDCDCDPDSPRENRIEDRAERREDRVEQRQERRGDVNITLTPNMN